MPKSTMARWGMNPKCCPTPTLSQILNDLVTLTDQLGALTQQRDDAKLAALAPASLPTAWALHTVAEVLAPLAGVPHAPQGGAS